MTWKARLHSNQTDIITTIMTDMCSIIPRSYARKICEIMCYLYWSLMLTNEENMFYILSDVLREMVFYEKYAWYANMNGNSKGFSFYLKQEQTA